MWCMSLIQKQILGKSDSYFVDPISKIQEALDRVGHSRQKEDKSVLGFSGPDLPEVELEFLTLKNVSISAT